MADFMKNLFRTGAICLFLWGPGPVLANGGGETEASADGRRHAIYTYYASLIAKLDATVSFCDGARTGYRAKFDRVITGQARGVKHSMMPSYDKLYDNFVLSLGDYACPENEVEHYRGRLDRQIKNLQRDLKALMDP